MLKRRIVYLLVALGVIGVGLASRRYRSYLPRFLGEYAGDTLWSAMVYAFISAGLAQRRIVVRSSLALAVAFLVELSQLYHAPWIDALRQNRLGGLVLGYGFLATDLVCYAVGIGLAATTDGLVQRRSERIGQPPQSVHD